MAFPIDVADRALAACGRHCCLCHRFCGTNIELHHMRQKADGGEDSYENCIPLCFDCHAEVGHYNPRHPKGRKFTEGELRQHRDSWYAKVAATPGPLADERFAELDRDVLLRIRTIVPRNGNMMSIRNHDYGSSFRQDSHEQLHEFLYQCDGPDFEFMDSDLEACRADLRAAVGEFVTQVAHNTWEVSPGTRVYSVPRDWLDGQPERWERTRETLNRLADGVAERYDRLIRTSRRKLGPVPADPE